MTDVGDGPEAGRGAPPGGDGRRAGDGPPGSRAEEGPVRSRCTTPDGVELAVYDFGGTGPDLLVVHATGFCAEVYTPMVAGLTGQAHCWGVDLRAHGRSQRPADGAFDWSGFAVDVLAVVDHLRLHRPLAFGHSCGGASLLLAEQARPGTFARLYGFEPVVFPGPPAPPTVRGNPLAEGALRRRETFPSAEDAFANFSSKPPFSVLDPEALRWYVAAGFEPVPRSEGGDGRTIRLRCRREDESQVYAHGGSHGAFERLGEVACPVTLACGQLTDAFGPDALEAGAARLPSSSVEELPGLGHFGPLERPDQVAASVLQNLVAPGTPAAGPGGPRRNPGGVAPTS